MEITNRLIITARGIKKMPIFQPGNFSGGGFFQPPPGQSLLDLVPNAVQAVSSRKLRSAYAGNAIKLRRSNDDALADIGFNGTGWLDESAMLAHVTSNSGYRHTWYDQSGSGFDYQNGTAAGQPKDIDTGTIQKLNGKPVSVFSDAHGLYSSADPTGDFTILAVFSSFETPLPTFESHVAIASHSDGNSGGIGISYSTYSGSPTRVISAYPGSTVTDSNVYKNNAASPLTLGLDELAIAMVTGSNATNGTTPLRLNVRSNSTWAGFMKAAEFVVWNRILSSEERATAFQNAGAAWEISI